jgi:hypothetical protein
MSEPKSNIDYCHMINEQVKKLTTLREENAKLKVEIDIFKARNDIMARCCIKISQLIMAEIKEYGDSSDLIEMRKILEEAILLINQRGEDD